LADRIRHGEIARLAIGLAILIALLIPLLSGLLPIISQSEARAIVELIGYKRVLILPVFLVLLAIFIHFYCRYVRLNTESDSPVSLKQSDEREPSDPFVRAKAVENASYLQTLSENEKYLLSDFMELDERREKIEADKMKSLGTVITDLTNAGILSVREIPEERVGGDPLDELTLHQWAWEILKEHPEYLK
jgi:hypothetical protein